MNNSNQDAPSTGATKAHSNGLLLRLPLNWQLSALYTALLVLTLGIIGTLVYSQQESFLVQDAGQRLSQQANQIASLQTGPPLGDNRDRGGQSSSASGAPPEPRPTMNPGSLGSQQPGEGPSSIQSNDPVVSNLIRGLGGPGITVAILNTDGTVITSTQGLEGGTTPIIEEVSSARLQATLQSSQPVQWVIQPADSARRIVVLTTVTKQPFRGSQQAAPTKLVIEQSASLAAADAALSRLGTYLWLGVLGGTLVGIALVLLFTRAVLRPLDRVVDTADAIAAGDLQRRLELPPGRSEVARLGKAFDYMVSRLVLTLEAQRRFVADASHELRTPLTSLKGLAEILVIGAHGGNTQVIEQSAGAINGELERLIRLVNDLLALSRLADSKDKAMAVTRRTQVDVCSIADSAVTQMGRLAEGRGVNLSRQCTEQLSMLADASQLKQIFLNLIDNALRYTPSGGDVALRVAQEDSNIRIEVQDTGSGIDPKDLPHVFERFYRGDTSRSRATGSSGLGLSIVQEIVTAYNGQIGVQSELGKGTCFTITLPLAVSTAAKEEALAHA